MAQLSYGDVDTEDDVDFEQYLGKWHEIARYANTSGAESHVGVTTEYHLLNDDYQCAS